MANRVSPVMEQKAPAQVKQTFDNIQKKLGRVVNMFRNLANSPEALNAYLQWSEFAERTSLPKQLREEIALVVAQANNCNYCLSAHSTTAKLSGLQDQEIISARKGQSQDKKWQAILKFCKSVVDKRGSVSDQEVQELKGFGVSDKELCEIVMVCNLNLFTNYFNKITNTENDFPPAPSI